MKYPLEVGTKVYINNSGHMIKMATMSIYGKKNLLLQEPKFCEGKRKELQAKIDIESQFKQTIIDIHLIMEKVSSNVQTYFDTVFLEAFPDVA